MYRATITNLANSRRYTLRGAPPPRKDIYIPPPLCESDDRRVSLNQEQRLVRRETALHEAAHLGVALALSGNWHRAFIRVPGKTPVNFWGHRNALGNVDAHHNEPFEEGCIMLAGLAVESLNPDREEAYLQLRPDLWDFKGHAKNCGNIMHPVYLDFDEVMAVSFRHVVENWAGIDAIAAGLLNLGRADGVVPRKNVFRIVEYYRSRQWVSRDTWRPAPTSEELAELLVVIRQKQSLVT